MTDDEREGLARAIEAAPNDRNAMAIAALAYLAPIRAREIAAAEARGVEMERARLEAELQDASTVHINMLRGGIAKISLAQFAHVHGMTNIDGWYDMTISQLEAAVAARGEHDTGKEG